MSSRSPAPRRRFLKTAATSTVAAGAMAAPMVSNAQTVSMRFQSTWPAKDIFHEYANDFAARVNDMAGGKVKIEVLPAGGWFTKILAPVLKDKDKLYVTHPAGFYADAFRPVKALPGLEKVEEIGWGASSSGSGGPFGPSGKWNVAPVDLVVTFLAVLAARLSRGAGRWLGAVTGARRCVRGDGPADPR